ncbi:hypothetical protein M0812_29028 [Anaeramoeba flamelloides]|uniref:Uncharacterized protein n=1 Tax=Anaeramoeba flamelloides TaxID=1746091 RepID=A0AAV7Y625_9EUKA|nr:hypothetical protein M0812_29028 [Anaeramoeba flamelloides]
MNSAIRIEERINTTTTTFFQHFYGTEFTKSFLEKRGHTDISVEDWSTLQNRRVSSKNNTLSPFVLQVFKTNNSFDQVEQYSTNDRNEFSIQSNTKVGSSNGSFSFLTNCQVIPETNNSIKIIINAGVICDRSELKETFEGILSINLRDHLDHWLTLVKETKIPKMSPNKLFYMQTLTPTPIQEKRKHSKQETTNSSLNNNLFISEDSSQTTPINTNQKSKTLRDLFFEYKTPISPKSSKQIKSQNLIKTIKMKKNKNKNKKKTKNRQTQFCNQQYKTILNYSESNLENSFFEESGTEIENIKTNENNSKEEENNEKVKRTENQNKEEYNKNCENLCDEPCDETSEYNGTNNLDKTKKCIKPVEEVDDEAILVEALEEVSEDHGERDDDDDGEEDEEDEEDFEDDEDIVENSEEEFLKTPLSKSSYCTKDLHNSILGSSVTTKNKYEKLYSNKELTKSLILDKLKFKKIDRGDKVKNLYQKYSSPLIDKSENLSFNEHNTPQENWWEVLLKDSQNYENTDLETIKNLVKELKISNKKLVLLEDKINSLTLDKKEPLLWLKQFLRSVVDCSLFFDFSENIFGYISSPFFSCFNLYFRKQ